MKREPDIQFRSPEEIRRYQEKRLAEALEYIAANSEFYRRMFREDSIDIRKARKIEHHGTIPLTTKTDLQNHNRRITGVPDSADHD